MLQGSFCGTLFLNVTLCKNCLKHHVMDLHMQNKSHAICHMPYALHVLQGLPCGTRFSSVTSKKAWLPVLRLNRFSAWQQQQQQWQQQQQQAQLQLRI
jgi:hypothetical protein